MQQCAVAKPQTADPEQPNLNSSNAMYQATKLNSIHLDQGSAL
jgi:hypothetical protein